MYPVLEVAKYIINRHIDLSHPITHIRLQKILYYCQAITLLETDKPLFNDKIVAWNFGPAIKEVSDKYKIKLNDKLNYEEINIELSSEHKKLINAVIDIKWDKDALTLARESSQDEIFQNTYEAGKGKEIKPQLIRLYFKQHPEKIYGGTNGFKDYVFSIPSCYKCRFKCECCYNKGEVLKCQCCNSENDNFRLNKDFIKFCPQKGDLMG